MDNLNTERGRAELWKNSTPEDRANLQELGLNLNLETGDVHITSKNTEADSSAPLFEWGLNTNTGHIEETTRRDNRERVVEREVNPDTLRIPDDFLHVEVPKGES